MVLCGVYITQTNQPASQPDSLWTLFLISSYVFHVYRMFCASFPMCILYKYLHKVFRNLLWQVVRPEMKISSSQTTVRTPSAYTYSNAYGNYGGMKCSLVRRTDGKNSRFAYKHSTLIVSCVYIHNLQHRHERCIRANHISSHQMELVPSRKKKQKIS